MQRNCLYDDHVQGGEATKTVAEGIALLMGFWARVWHREIPDHCSVAKQISTVIRGQAEWNLPAHDAETLRHVAAKLRGSTGVDGWCGDELAAADLPLLVMRDWHGEYGLAAKGRAMKLCV